MTFLQRRMMLSRPVAPPDPAPRCPICLGAHTTLGHQQSTRTPPRDWAPPA